MRIRKLHVKNFRLLQDVELHLEETVTVVVGRNNSGKTSLSDIVRKFLEDKSNFRIEDFSTACYDGFCGALRAWRKGKDLADVRSLIPAIELRLHIAYDPKAPEFGPLKDFVIDTDDACDETIVVCRRELTDGAIPALFKGFEDVILEGPEESVPDATRLALFRTLTERVPALFATRMWAEAPNDPSNVRGVQPAAVKALISLGFINAQRGLDSTTSRETNVLAKVLESLFMSAALPTADGAQRNIAEGLQAAVEAIQETIDKDFKTQLRQLMPTIEDFGYPGLDGPELEPDTQLDVLRLLSNFTRIHYAGYSGVALPESYNGLGFRNLLFILLQIVGFYREFRACLQAPGVHLIVIEEPEAHLHPQMQDVFIRQLSTIVRKLCEREGQSALWPVQFLVSTHSPHIANEAPFEAIRYFAAVSSPQRVGVRFAEVRDLRTGLGGEMPETIDFLHQYLTLTRCDLFFADKAVLIEGTSERLILPQVVRRLDTADPNLKLGSQYITIMEVGGAYAHLFFPLLKFLDLRSLIITDLDPMKKGVNGKWGTCLTHEGDRTSNACLNRWFSSCQTDEKLTPELVEADDNPEAEGRPTLHRIGSATDKEKTKGKLRIAYQISEADGGPCGRTFEDAFILANAPVFGLTGESNELLAATAQEIARKQRKSKFALTYAIRRTDWTAPRYIAEGLRWLAQGNVSLVAQASAGTEGARTPRSEGLPA